MSTPQSLAAILTTLVSGSKTIDPKPLTYRGVLMRSTLETDFARHLDAMDSPWVYQPYIFGRKGAGYLPDFRVQRDDGSPVFIEVKPTAAEVPLARERMEVIWKTVPEAVLMVACAQGSEFSVAVKGQPWETFVELWKHV